MTEQKPGDDLRGARWEPQGKAGSSFRPKLPWRYIALVTLLVFGAGAWAVRSRATNLRDKRDTLVSSHQELIGARGLAITKFRSSVEAMILRAAAMKRPDQLEPGFTLESLRGKSGVYIRIRESDAVDAGTIRQALEIMEPDAIAHCLGLTPVAIRTLYTKDAPLLGHWLEEARASRDSLRLEVRIDEVARFARRDLPVLESIAKSDYVLLTIVRGDSRANDEVDVYVFDAQTGRLRLATNTKANGYLLTARIEGYRAPTPSQAALARSGATDCSIAAQARTRTGEFGAVEGNGPVDAGVGAAIEAVLDAGLEAGADISANGIQASDAGVSDAAAAQAP